MIKRLKHIESCINNDENLKEVNAEFCRRAFTLLADCDLITEENVRFLSDPAACESYDPKLQFPYNRSEAILRKAEHADDIYDQKGYQRFYRENKMCVFCGGIKYLIANNWFAEGGGLPANKRAFFNWLTLQAQSAVKTSREV